MRILVNETWVSPGTSPGRPALDFIRQEMGLKGTKEGCREGDCGACAVLVGEFNRETLPDKDYTGKNSRTSGFQPHGAGTMKANPRYRAMPSCLLALAELDGKHLITIEGLASVPGGLSPVMKAFLQENASQCGFCSPGFIISLSAWLAGSAVPDIEGALKAVDGNLCRCTGYASIRRAAEILVKEFADLPAEGLARLECLVERSVLPASVLEFASLSEAQGRRPNEEKTGVSLEERENSDSRVFLGGGTDYYVRNPEPPDGFSPLLLGGSPEFSGIERVDSEAKPWLRLGAALRISDFFASHAVRESIPGIEEYEGLFASTLVRNLATLGGNIVNASPVADMSAILLSLGALAEISKTSAAGLEHRRLPLDKFFLGYKRVDLQPGEFLSAIFIPASSEGSVFSNSGSYDGEQSGESLTDRFEGGIGFGAKGGRLFFSFEKIAKRQALDIAAVNTAMAFRLDDTSARAVRISAGGVAEIPLLLPKAAALMEGNRIKGAKAKDLAELCSAVSLTAQEEVSPIDDVRGSALYRRAMIGRLVKAHFLRFFAKDGIAEELEP